MNTTSSTRFILVPRRDGTLCIGRRRCDICCAAADDDDGIDTRVPALCSCRVEQRSVVPISDGEIFGRTELWSALYHDACQPTAVGDANVMASSDTINKFDWATRILPRDMLRATTHNEDHNVLLWVHRKKHCYVSERVIELVRGGDTLLAMNKASSTDADGRTWVGPTVLEHGDILQFRQPNEAVLEFQLCRVLQNSMQLLEAQNQQQQELVNRREQEGSKREMENDDGSKFRGITVPNYCCAEMDCRNSDDENDGSEVENNIEDTIGSQAELQQPVQKPLPDFDAASYQNGALSRRSPLSLQKTEPQGLSSVPPDVKVDQSGAPTKALLSHIAHEPPKEMFSCIKPVSGPERMSTADPDLLPADQIFPPAPSSIRTISDQLVVESARSLAAYDGNQNNFTQSAPEGSDLRASEFAVDDGNCKNTTPPVSDPSSKSLGATQASVAFADDATTVPDEQFIVYICQLGQYLNNWRYDSVKPKGIKQKAKERGALVLDSFDKNQPPWPTHLVISSDTADEDVPSYLGFSDHDEMLAFLEQHRIVCVKPDWILEVEFTPLRKPPPFRKPAMEHLRHKFGGKSKRTLPHSVESPASSRQRTEDSTTAPPNLNTDLSDMFRKISKLYADCPLDKGDAWKSYSYQKAAGRLCYLDFKVDASPQSINRLKEVNGFGKSMIEDVTEYFSSSDGKCSRLRMFETHKRLGLRAMKKIWGVGQAKALELVDAGYYRIGDVRRALEQGALKLERNQLIGVMYYEDFQEKMSRSEVESIFQVICAEVRDRYPQAEMHLMGSYRRGKETCGDADVIFWSPTILDEVPPKALGKIVDSLRAKGHIEHHLTQISGMNAAAFETLDPKDARKLINPETYGRSSAKTDRTNSSSWMGVFRSPIVPGKRRHVDIKFYPYKERVYASLYFTGNGFFNRSMRLWARHKHNLKLSDHGLFATEGNCVLENANTEKAVFDLLNLQWKEPHERNNFDDVQSKEPGESTLDLLDSLNKNDLMHDENQAWIA